jgi:HPt (histidine-containing phosphotransfer) domain-containing protein
MNVKIYKHINLDYLEMMSDGDDSMKKTMLEMLLDELPQEVKKMAELLEQKNWETLSSVSHKMKSTLAFVGNEEMTAANKQVELIAKSTPSPESLEDLINVLKSACPMAITELEEELSKL